MHSPPEVTVIHWCETSRDKTRCEKLPASVSLVRRRRPPIRAMHWGRGEEDTSGLSLERVPWTPANVLQSPLCFVVLSWSLCFVLLPGGISFLLLCCGLLVPCSSSRPASLTGVGAGINLVTLGSTLGLNKEDTTSSSSFHWSELGRDQLLTWNSPRQAARTRRLGGKHRNYSLTPEPFPFLSVVTLGVSYLPPAS